jgi:hypothetical protein
VFAWLGVRGWFLPALFFCLASFVGMTVVGMTGPGEWRLRGMVLVVEWQLLRYAESSKPMHILRLVMPTGEASTLTRCLLLPGGVDASLYLLRRHDSRHDKTRECDD